jgi:hypothetical protein
MASTHRKALTTYRRRLKRRGVVRLEVHVRKEDAALVRGVRLPIPSGRRNPGLAARTLWGWQGQRSQGAVGFSAA